MTFNPLDHPIVFEEPRLLTDASAWAEHIPFAFLLADLCRSRTFVELGTHKGDAYCAFCQAIAALNVECRCTAIDTWAGDAHAGAYGPDLLKALRAHHDPLYGAFSRLLPKPFDDAAKEFADGSIDLLHIDGLHTYDAVKHDFETWLPKMSERGVVLFHDTEERARDFGVWKLWEEVSEGRPRFSFLHGHGLGVLGVGSALPEGLRALFAADANARERDAIRACFACLGRPMETRRALAVVAALCFREQQAINQWKQQIGAPVAPQSALPQSAAAQPIAYVNAFAADVRGLLHDDIMARRQLAQRGQQR